MTAAKLFCIHQFRGGKQLLKSVCNGRNIVRMNDIKSIDCHEFLGSISLDTFYGRTGIGNDALRRVERDGFSTEFDEYTDTPVAGRSNRYSLKFYISVVCSYSPIPS